MDGYSTTPMCLGCESWQPTSRFFQAGPQRLEFKAYVLFRSHPTTPRTTEHPNPSR
jgi:hypothetical protein